ncbi:MAG: outer membrane beta-barrel protein [Flavisolibacter sp.]
MRNEFEKQVREKMEALDVSPSAPVWQHVKREISGKKDRRRFFFWVLFAALLTVGGYFLLSTGRYEKETSRLENKPEIQKPSTQNSNSNSRPGADSQVTEPAKDAIVNDEKIRAAEKLIQSTMAVAEAMAKDAMNSNPVQNAGVTPAEKNRNTETVSAKEKTSIPAVQKNDDSTVTAGVVMQPLTDSIMIEEPHSEADSLKTLSPKAAKKKFVVSVFGGAGSSKSASGFGLFEKSAADFSSSPGSSSGVPPTNSLPPAPEKAGFSFTAGVNFNKQLNAHFSLAAGLTYNYLSTTVKTGQTITRDTTLYLNSRVIRLENYFLNSSGANQNYTNQFHFVGLPVTLNYTVSEKFPLHVSAGVSLRQLLATNALLYDFSGQFYYKDKEAFRKTQVFTSVGLSYSAGKLNIGPYLDYGLSKTMKEGDSKKHLYAAGLKAEFFLKK